MKNLLVVVRVTDEDTGQEFALGVESKVMKDDPVKFYRAVDVLCGNLLYAVGDMIGVQPNFPKGIPVRDLEKPKP